MKKHFLEAGKIINTHGIHGEVKIEPWTNGPEFLSSFDRIFIDGKPIRLLNCRIQKCFLIALLEGFDNIESAITLKNKTIYIDRFDAHLEDGEYFLQDIIGMRVVNEQDGQELGTISDFIELPANLVYVVRGTREILIPAVPEFIIKIDIDNDTMTVKLIEGM